MESFHGLILRLDSSLNVSEILYCAHVQVINGFLLEKIPAKLRLFGGVIIAEIGLLLVAFSIYFDKIGFWAAIVGIVCTGAMSALGEG